MELRHNLFLGLTLVICASGVARADTLELSQLGAQEIAKIEQAEAGKYGGRPIIQRHVDPRSGSQFGFVRGMIIMEHGGAGDLNFTGPGATELNNQPEKFFKFRPFNWITRNGNNINWADFRFEWKWISSVRQEIDTLDDLCALVSWRCQAQPNGDPVAAMQRGLQWFAGSLDPKNQLNLGGGGQAATNQAHEGSVTRYLLYGTMSSGERGTRAHDCRKLQGPIGEYGNFDEATQKARWQPKGVKFTPMDPDWVEESPEVVIVRLVEAIARCQKKGNNGQKAFPIPFADQIQACARLVGQFLTDDLARVPAPEAASNDEKAKRVRSFAFRARAALMGLVEGATPERVAALRRNAVARGGPVQGVNVIARQGEADIDAQLRYSKVDDDMPVTVFDMASAALDVILFDDGSNRAGMLAPFDDDRTRVVGSLLRVAAGAQAYNGGVQNLQIQDTVGYKAINTVALLAEGRDAQKFRDELLDTIANPGNQMRSNAARSALVRAGADGPQLYRELQSLFEIALAAAGPEQQQSFYESPPASGNFLPHSGHDPRREDAMFVIKQLARRSQDGARMVRDRVQQLRNRQTAGTGSPEEKKLLDQFGNN